jgi:nucleoside-diphosphate-sugar epimerase
LRIFVTGGGGYVGTTLVPFLIEKGHSVTLLDRFFFGEKWISSFAEDSRLEVIRGDVRWFDGAKLRGYDAVVDLAALSNDPSGELNPWKTFEINYLGRSRVARFAKEAGVSRYILFSSCSIYGFQEGIMTEESKLNPLTMYARANALAEKDNLALADDSFAPTALRFATMYGLSKRMRFDIAINGMVLGAYKTGKIPVMRDGSQWRPFIYVGDVANAVQQVLEASASTVRGKVFNTGSDDQNYQIGELARVVAESLQHKTEVTWYGDPDRRSYRVSFAKAKDIGITPNTKPEAASRELEQALESGAVVDSPETYTVNWYKHLLSDSSDSEEVKMNGVIL